MARRGRAHSFVGTATYMSPERLQGEPYGPPADVWSLGLTLLTLALGAYPLEVILMVTAGVSRMLRVLVGGVPSMVQHTMASSCSLVTRAPVLKQAGVLL